MIAIVTDEVELGVMHTDWIVLVWFDRLHRHLSSRQREMEANPGL